LVRRGRFTRCTIALRSRRSRRTALFRTEWSYSSGPAYGNRPGADVSTWKLEGERQSIRRDQLTVHADRGTSMTSKPVALMLADLGVTKSHSRPHVSNDNPFSESQFKTMKYRPDFPERFGAIEDGRAHCADFFGWYNTEHGHGGLGLVTPHDIHHGLAAARLQARDVVLAAAFAERPEWFPAGVPSAGAVPSDVWINKPQLASPTEEARQ
jgi:putative transposase